MEKYSKPVMVLEKIEDEVYTATADYPAPVLVSGETTPDTSPVPGVIN